MKTKITLLMLFVLFIQSIVAQTLPTPIRHYPLDNGDPTETVKGQSGIVDGTVSGVEDRFGDKTGATRFDVNAYISTPNFFTGSTCKNGYTISFWIYVDSLYNKVIGPEPWSKSALIHRAFFAADGDNALLGFYQRGDRAVIDRYVLDTSDLKKNFGIWYWDPVNFTNRTGWYHIIMSQKTNKMTLYVFYPNSEMVYALHYMGVQDLDYVTDWGIGSKWANGTTIVDDLYVYDTPIDKDQAILMHSQQGPPYGMYNIVSAALNQCCQSYEKNVSNSAVEVNTPTEGDEALTQWVIEPVDGKPYVCKIHMAYIDNKYIYANGRDGDYAYSEYDVGYDSYKWIVIPADDGYFYLKNHQYTNLYLKSVAIPGGTKSMLCASSYNAAEDTRYKWKFSFLKTIHETTHYVVKTNTDYELIPNSNCLLGLMPKTPFTESSSPMYVTRGITPSLLDQYVFKPAGDGSFYIYSVAFPTKLLQVKDNNVTNKQAVVLNDWNSGNRYYCKFIIEKPNPLGRYLKIVPIMGQTMDLYSGDYRTIQDVTIRRSSEGESSSHSWISYESHGKTNANKQISTVTPGVYKISTMLSGNRSICPLKQVWYGDAEASLADFSNDIETSFYWLIDYEKDAYGQPIKDGTYTVKLLGTDGLYLAAYSGNIYNNARVYVTEMNVASEENAEGQNIGFYKWFIEPTRDGTGSYYFQSAADRWIVLHCADNIGAANSLLDFAYPNDSPNSYKWKLEKVDIQTILEPGVYRIANLANLAFYVHTANSSTHVGSQLSLGKYDSSETFKWRVELHDDCTYSIHISESSPALYMHSYGTAYSSKVRIDTYESRQAPTFRWIIYKLPGTTCYYLRLVGNPSAFLHLEDNYVGQNAGLEVYKYVEAVDDTYLWYFKPLTDSDDEVSAEALALAGIEECNEDSSVDIIYRDMIAYICSDTEIKNVDVFNSIGQMCYHSTPNNTSTSIPLSRGLSVIVVTLENGTTKVFKYGG